MAPALLLGALLTVVARAQEGVHYRFLVAPDVSAADCEEARASVAKVFSRLPGLFDPTSVRTFTCIPPVDNAFYDQDEKRVRLDPFYLKRFARSNPGFIRPGEEAESVIVHELAHAFVAAHPGQDEIYREVISRNRLKKFRRKYYRPSNRAARLFLVLHDARERVAIGTESKQEYARRRAIVDGTPSSEAEEEWDEYTRKYTLEEARRVVDEFGPKLARAEARMRELMEARRAPLADRFAIPRRTRDDLHATDADTEWFAYGAEIYYHAASPDEWLTPAEKQWWKNLEPAFTARHQPLPPDSTAARQAASTASR